VLVGAGLFGIVTYLVEQRLREYGVRLALGAAPRDIWRSVIRQQLGPVAGGALLGSAGSFWAMLWLRSRITGLPPAFATPAGLAFVLVLTIALAAALRPARRAMRVDPLTILRAE
jgi:ABC-type antimicrobial peptide transport system permease subunit